MSRNFDLTSFIFTTVKLLAALFVLKVLLMAVGFPGYIPVADEVYSFFMKAIFSISGNPNVLPHGLK